MNALERIQALQQKMGVTDVPILIRADGQPVRIGGIYPDFRGEYHHLLEIILPHKPASTGRVVTDKGSFYPSVLGFSWAGRTDQ